MANMEPLFQLLDETSDIIQKHSDWTYLEALAVSGENLFQQDV